MDASLLARVERIAPASILLLGASDTGKTTVIEQLLAEWHHGEPIAVVDCDVGQSHVGPPTTVAWGLLDGPFTGWRRVEMQRMAFTGGVSPEGNADAFLEAVGRVVDSARQHTPRLLIDTTGLVRGDLGLVLKRRKMARIKPDLVIALQREQELEELLASLPETGIERRVASPHCARRTLPERAAYRDYQFARYFANSVTQALSLGAVRLIGLGPDWPTGRVTLSPAALVDRAVGLRNAQGDDLALGLLRDVDLGQGRLTVLTPLREISAVTALAVGSVRWPDAGDQ